MTCDPVGLYPFSATPAKTVGLGVTAAGAVIPDPGMPEGGYLPIFDPNTHCVDPNNPSDPTTYCVIGFGFVQASGGQVTRIDLRIASANATAAISGGANVANILPIAEGALLAPALVR